MANKPINRYSVQIVFDDGGYLRWMSKPGARLSRLEVADQLAEIVETIWHTDTVLTKHAQDKKEETT